MTAKTDPPDYDKTRRLDLSSLYALVKVRGSDARRFLHAQLTADIKSLSSNQACYAAYCNPKGRVLATMLVIDTGQGFSLLMDPSLAESVTQRLGLFVLRDDVQIQLDPSQPVSGIMPARVLIRGQVRKLSGLSVNSKDGIEVHLPDGRLLLIGTGTGEAPPDAWARQDICAGIARVTPATTGMFIPQMLGLEKIEAVSFSKGCYPGQEIVARTRYLGKLKRRMVQFESAVAMSEGQLISGKDGSIGQVVSCVPLESGEVPSEHSAKFLAKFLGQAVLKVAEGQALPEPLKTSDQEGLRWVDT